MAKIYYFLGHEQFHPEKLVEDAVSAESAGFDGLFVSEHFHPWVKDVGTAGFALSTLGAIAVKTKKIELMTGVVSPLFRYHPGIVAQAAATIDRLSNGRFSLGVGTGEAINEIPLGYEFPNHNERSERMIEALRIMRKLLDGKKITFNGKYYQTKEARLYSPPLHNIPIYMSAGGPKSSEIAAHYSDGIIVSAKDNKETLEKIIKPARKVNKNTKVIAARWSIFSGNDTEAWNALKPWRGLRVNARNKAYDPELLQNEADRMDKKEILSRYFIVKSADDYIHVYSPLIRELKADIIVLQTTATGNHKELIEFLGNNVIPSLKRL